MLKFYYTAFLGALAFFANAQCNGRYQQEIFSSVDVVTENYSDVYSGPRHQMDIYTPVGDTATQRPVIFYMHGGSFYTGDKNLQDCVDFCTYYAKRGYVAVSINYRLADLFQFIASQETQFVTVLKAVADVKAGIRFMRKSFENGNPHGIDTSTIFVGGYSAGAVIALHLATINQVSDLPTSPINAQALIDSIGGDLEGDAGNFGYSSKVNGVVSFAGGINDVNLFTPNDPPLVAVHGTDDATVSFNCGPGLNNPAILNLCGANEMYPAARAANIIADTMIFQGAGHGWPSGGLASPQFAKAVQFSVDFNYRLLPCYNGEPLSITQPQPDKFLVYPNPSNGVFNIQQATFGVATLYNLLGDVVYQTNTFEGFQTLNVAHLPKGFYLLRLNTGNETQNVKIQLN